MLSGAQDSFLQGRYEVQFRSFMALPAGNSSMSVDVEQTDSVRCVNVS
jgi:hypothetical protein